MHVKYGEDFQLQLEQLFIKIKCDFRGRREGRFGIPQKCLCGSDVVISTAHAGTDPVRRFYCCNSNNTLDGRHHIRKWWDEAAMMDEVNVLIEKVDELSNKVQVESDANLSNLNGFVSRPEMETLRHNLQKVVEEIEQLKETIRDPNLVEKMKKLEKRDAHRSELQFKIAVVVSVVVIFMALIIWYMK
ncbi:unnamed protein product [Thlaspi arvense]|uniref:GRF-type domain-containing protein n=1 Tax=Thlaspi arvense TaxID=13288 RepID=A0AAU9RPH9_THLAR|nr:unnamed protein product [Thlaspi arvense]